MARSTAEIKGFEGANIAWIEEAEALTKEQWEIIEPTVRAEGSEIWMSYNPRLEDDFIETFNHDLENGVYIKHINYNENPFLSETMQKKIARLKAKDFKEYEHIYLGIPRRDHDDAVIKRSWILAAIDAHKALSVEPLGVKIIGFDVADGGADKNATVSRHGCLAYRSTEWQAEEHEINKSSMRVYSEAINSGSEITFDSIGVGAGAGSKFKELNDNGQHTVRFHKFNAGGAVIRPERMYQPSVKNKDFFANLKAQTWWSVADMFKATYNAVVNGDAIEPDMIISIASDMKHKDQLITELSTPKKDFDNHGRVKVESKKDLAKRGVKSPNIADSFIMAFADVRRPPPKNIVVKPLGVNLSGR